MKLIAMSVGSMARPTGQDRIRYLEKLSFYCRDKSVDLLSYCLLGIARRHSDVGLGELARYLQVKELSTPSHAVRRAEERMKNDRGFARQLRRVLKILDHSSIDSAEKPLNLIC